MNVISHVVIALFDQIDNFLHGLEEDVLEPGVKPGEFFLERALCRPGSGQSLGRSGNGVELDYAVTPSFFCGVQCPVSSVHQVRVRFDILGTQIRHTDRQSHV